MAVGSTGRRGNPYDNDGRALAAACPVTGKAELLGDGREGQARIAAAGEHVAEDARQLVDVLTFPQRNRHSPPP